MASKSLMFLAAAVAASLLATMPMESASAGGSPVTTAGPSCKNGGGKTIVINKPVSIYKPVTINNSVAINKSISIYKPVTITNDISVYKPVTINNDVNIYKPVTINNDVNIDKNIDINKNVNINNDVNINKNVNIDKNININNNVNINKNIVIDKSSAVATAEASAQSAAQAFAQARAGATATGTSFGGSYIGDTIINHNEQIGNIHTSEACEMQEATVVKAIHMVCVAANGEEFPASHMIAETWIDSSYEGEIARCIPGATVKVVIGDVVQSDQGMAGSYANGAVLACGPHEALRHFKNGMLKCVPEVPVKDCTERTNLRKYGTGDLFFSYRSAVCIAGGRTANKTPLDLNGMTLEGGVGDGN